MLPLLFFPGGASSTGGVLPSKELLECVVLLVVPVQWRKAATLIIILWLFLLTSDPAGHALCVSCERLCWDLFFVCLI